MGPKRRVRVFISLVYFAVTSVQRLLRRVFGVPQPAQFVVLYYHGVPSRTASGFVNQVNAVSRAARVIAADHVGPLDSAQRYVAFTFDDALESIASNAIPELVRRSYPATVFVPVGIVGRSPNWADWEKDGAGSVDLEPVMTVDQMLALDGDLITFGSHSMTHERLPDTDEAGLRRELDESRSQLEAQLDRKVSLFAFPYGAFDDRILERCRGAGYKRVFSTIPSAADPVGGDYVRGRVAVEPDDTRLEFYLKLRGAYAWLPMASAVKRSILRRGQSSRVHA